MISSPHEIKRIKVMELLVNGEMSNQEAAESLSLCRRRIIRLRKKYKARGEMALIQGNRGKHPRQRKRKGCTALHAYIDDARGIVVGAYLTENESTSVYVSALAMGKERRLSTFEQGVKCLGTGKLFALSPEAKGRVECLWNVLQDRLPGKLRLPDVSDIEDSNKVLSKFLTQGNRKFMVVPSEQESAYVEPEGRIDMDFLFARREMRRMDRGGNISRRGRTYAPRAPQSFTMAHAAVMESKM